MNTQTQPTPSTGLKHGFDWGLIHSFLAALDSGSLLGASRQLRISQPTVGRHIAELESQLGVVLFERTGRGLVPSAVALSLAESARQMESAAQQLARDVTGAQTQTGGTVRISASVPVAVQLMPTVLANMRASLPHIQIELVATNEVSNLLRREADIAVRLVRPDQATLIAKKIGDVRIGAFANRDYLARKPPIKQLTDMLGHELIGSDTEGAILQGFHAMGYPVTPQAFALRTDDLIVQWRAIQAGLGIGFVAHYMAATDARVVAVLPDHIQIPPLPMWLAVHREIHANPRIRSVFDFLGEALPKLI